MVGRNVTHVELSEAVRQRLGLSRAASANLVGQVLAEICDTPAAGETMKLSGFGIFTVHDKRERIGGNPKTGEAVPIDPRRVILFKVVKRSEGTPQRKQQKAPRSESQTGQG